MRTLPIPALVVAALTIAVQSGAEPTPVCEQRLLGGQSYECIAKVSDPAGLCFRRCVTVVDTIGGFDLEVDQALGSSYVLHCGCGDFIHFNAGPRWLVCTGSGNQTSTVGKVTPGGRRIRRGFASYQNGAWTDDYTCVRSAACVPEFGPCSAFGVE